jgi:hypothetical protein
VSIITVGRSPRHRQRRLAGQLALSAGMVLVLVVFTSAVRVVCRGRCEPGAGEDVGLAALGLATK